VTTVDEALAGAASRIAAALDLDSASARVEARSLLRHALRVDTAWLAAHGRDALAEGAERARFEALLARRLGGEPVAYLTGGREFFGLDFVVSPAVLIPRPETETLVEAALDRISPDGRCRVLDLGTGSGCVAIAIARHLPRAEVTAVDASEGALAVARENANRILGPGRLRLLGGDWFAPVAGERFGLVIANPPYVAEGDPHLSRGDLRFEPRAALVAGTDGLDCIRRIVREAPAHLSPGGWLLFEHGYDQAETCRNLLGESGLQEVISIRDLSGSERVSGARRLTL
jgi:release factor glutamine methyltransferase